MSHPNQPGVYISLSAARFIYAQVSERTGVSVDDLLSERRARHVVRARWQVMRAMRDRGASLPMIAKRMLLNHATVLYGLRVLESKQNA
jgi:chromosomal replication initiation ATPase DnaA